MSIEETQNEPVQSNISDGDGSSEMRVTSETSMHRFWLVPGEPMLDEDGRPYGDNTKCTEFTEVWIRGIVNYQSVVSEFERQRLARSYRFFYETGVYVPVIDKGGAIQEGDYIVRSSIPGFFERAPVQQYMRKPYGIARSACSFNPELKPIYRPKKILKTSMVEVPVEKDKIVRKYSLVKEWKENLQQWVGIIQESAVTEKEPVWKEESVYDEKGQLLHVQKVPATETRIVVTEEDEIDVNGNPVQEIVGETLEYQITYVNRDGMFESGYREGLYKMHYLTLDVFNYTI